ncbi:histidine kinase [Microbacterium sp. WCS2018Hpa-23]|uniref:sensor histidine kinase n=1 Tax=Microbacterium sp. WCS2018Hpa-23 TaxID=3073634 RepID=UPI0028830EFB|nr:histidine kinase [Microbacterium sp. WCS2018Hpa-23]
MSRTRSRSTSVREDEALRLPRPPGVLRRFWARHPVVADVLIALVCLLLSLVPAGVITNDLPMPLAIGVAILVPASVVAACATLLWRRRRPVIPFVASFALEAGFLFALQPIGSPLLLVTCYSLAVYRSSRAAWTGFGIGLASLGAIGGLLTLSGVITLQIAANAVIMSLVLGLIGTLIGVNVGGRKRYLDAVIDRSRQLLVERDQQAQLAAAAERARIAREMHDIVSHSLTVIVALSEGASATSDPEQARAAATASAETARSALSEMRAMLGVLRADDSPLPLAPLAPTPPQETVAHAQRAGYPVTLSVSGGADLSPAVAHAVGRIVQEGVTNAMRHAPGATAIAVRLVYTADGVTAEIVNDGATGPVGTSGFGLRGLAERAAHAGGTVVSEPLEGGRWMLRAELPTTPDPSEPTAPDLEDRP